MKMELDADKAWFKGIPWRASPHRDARPKESTIELVVIHGISLPPGQFGGPFVDALFMHTLAGQAHPDLAAIADLKVSAHCFIQRTGVITQYVSLQDRAWHAGVSCFAGRQRCNDFSVGIELEGCDHIPYAEIQYQQLAKLIRLLRENWPLLTQARIVGHSDIAPGRKTDPGPAFDWSHLWTLL